MMPIFFLLISESSSSFKFLKLLPSKINSPELNFSKPAINIIKLVLPEPLSPMTAIDSL